MELLLLLLPFSSFTHLTRCRLASPRYGDPVPPGSGARQAGRGPDGSDALRRQHALVPGHARAPLGEATWVRGVSTAGGWWSASGALRRLGEVEASEMGRPWWCDMSVVSATKKHWLNGCTTTP